MYPYPHILMLLYIINISKYAINFYQHSFLFIMSIHLYMVKKKHKIESFLRHIKSNYHSMCLYIQTSKSSLF